MTENITNSIDSALQLISDSGQFFATEGNIDSDSQTYIQQSDAATTSLQKAASALVQYVQTAMMSSDSSPASDSTAALHEMATAFMLQTAATISESVTAFSAPQSNTSDEPIPAKLTQASSTFVQHLGDMLVNPQASDRDPSAVLMQDVQEIWKNKAPTDTLASTATTIWESVKSSQHLPVFAGMLASVIFKKK